MSVPPQAPPSWTASPASITETAKALCDERRQLLDRIVADVSIDTACFANVILPLVQQENRALAVSHILEFYQHASPDAAVRDASSQATQLRKDAAVEVAMREDVFRLVDAVYGRLAADTLDPESRRLVEKEWQAAVRHGLGLPTGAPRARFAAIQKRLAELAGEFQKNLNEESGGLWFSPAQLDGLPQNVLDALEHGAGDRAGQLRLSFKLPDVGPTLSYVRDEDVRQAACVGNLNKCPNNVEPFRETMVLRDEAARLLGFANHAAMRLQDRMAKDPKVVLDFLHNLRDQLLPRAKEEMARMQAVKDADRAARGLPADGDMYVWDHSFYSNMMLRDEHGVDHEKISEFFPLHETVSHMLKDFEKLMGLVFVEITDADTWHPDVSLFSVWDDDKEGNAFLGYLYLDMHPRPGKNTGPSNMNIQPGFVAEDGTRHYPSTALICSFTKPTPTQPSLLSHDEVVTLFHELGHGIHDLCARTTYARFHGTTVVEDFCEAPSQMLEYWCWSPPHLKALSRHFESGDQLPEELIDSLVKSKHVNGAMFVMRQLSYALFDLAIHMPSSHDEIERENFAVTFNDLRDALLLLKGPKSSSAVNDWCTGHTTFGHMFHGYDVGMYGYLWSEAIAADIFSSTFGHDLYDDESGRRYRHMILEKGSSQDEMVTLENFLGRKPSNAAFYQDHGIV